MWILTSCSLCVKQAVSQIMYIYLYFVSSHLSNFVNLTLLFSLLRQLFSCLILYWELQSQSLFKPSIDFSGKLEGPQCLLKCLFDRWNPCSSWCSGQNLVSQHLPQQPSQGQYMVWDRPTAGIFTWLRYKLVMERGICGPGGTWM